MPLTYKTFEFSYNGDYDNPQILKLAENRLHKQGIDNFSVVAGTVAHLPFLDNNFDAVTVMMAPHHLDEIFRVLNQVGN